MPPEDWKPLVGVPEQVTPDVDPAMNRGAAMFTLAAKAPTKKYCGDGAVPVNAISPLVFAVMA
jgi:hypothetical protein